MSRIIQGRTEFPHLERVTGSSWTSRGCGARLRLGVYACNNDGVTDCAEHAHDCTEKVVLCQG